MERFYPKAEVKLSGIDGGRMIGGPARGVLHTTETSNWAGSESYHVAVKEEDGEIRWQQYIPFDRAGRGLRHAAGTIDTNRMGSACIQVAIVGYAKDSSKLSRRMLNAIADFMIWCNGQFNIRTDFPIFQGSQAYGTDAPSRFSDSKWKAWNGWCGHQNVPNNTHWDPGIVDQYFLVARLRGWDGSTPFSVEPRVVYDFLVQQGVSSDSALGILANIQTESKFKPGAIGDGGTSGGLFQHHAGRFHALEMFANSVAGTYWTDWKTQVLFALQEAKQLKINLQATDPKAATREWMVKFERPGDQSEANIQRRIDNLSLFNFGAAPTPTPAPVECKSLEEELANHGFKDICDLLDTVVKLEEKARV